MTRCLIIVKVDKKDIGTVLTHEFNGKEYSITIEKPYIRIYSHGDGYPHGTGKALLEKWDTYKKALELISGGDCHFVYDGCADYKMDWEGHEDWDVCNPRQNDDLNFDAGWVSYVYVFQNNKWYFGLVDYKTEKIQELRELTNESTRSYKGC